MKPKEQTFDTTNSYEANLVEWILAIAKAPFNNKIVFKTYSSTLEKISEEVKELTNYFETDFFDTYQNPQEGGETNCFFIVEILPIQGRQDFDGVWVRFYLNNKANFGDMDYQNYQKYFEENDIEQGKEITWQEAYDKICDLAKKEQNLVPKLQQ